MPQIFFGTIRVVIVTILLALLLGHGVAVPNAEAPIIRTVDINPACSGYSAVVDAEDLAAFIQAPISAKSW